MYVELSLEIVNRRRELWRVVLKLWLFRSLMSADLCFEAQTPIFHAADLLSFLP